MEIDIKSLIELKLKELQKEKERLKNLENKQYDNCDTKHQLNNNVQQSTAIEDDDDDKENLLPRRISLNNSTILSSINKHNEPLIEQVDIEENKTALINKIINSESPLLSERSSDDKTNRKMLRYGEYSPNNPQLRVNAAPYLGLGEYEQRKNLFLQKQKADYLNHLAKQNQTIKPNNKNKNVSLEQPIKTSSITKAVQTDIKNINSRLVQYDLQSENYYSNESDFNETTRNTRQFVTSPSISMQNNRNFPTTYRVDQRLTSAQNALLKPEMDKPKSILSNRRTGSPRERLMSDLNNSYTPSFLDGFSYQDRAEEIERERIKREQYNQELRLQIEEKRRLQAMREEQEHRQQELENRRLEQQLLRMQEEQFVEEQRRNQRDEQMRRHSEDLLRRKHELQTIRQQNYRAKHDLECSSSSSRNTNVASLSHYSPPVSRRNLYTSYNIPSVTNNSLYAVDSINGRYNPSRFDSSYNRKDALNRMDSLNTTSNRLNTFNRYDSLSRIDSLNRHDTLNRIEPLSINDNSLSNIQRRHSATQQDLSMFKRSPKLQRRSSSSRFDDTLPIPVLKAHSPVAKELKNSVPFNSNHSRHHSSEALRKLEDKWQIPAVQKNIVNHGDVGLRDGQSRSILTQLGAIRMQLQQEQLRMDETLRKRGFTQSKAVDLH